MLIINMTFTESVPNILFVDGKYKLSHYSMNVILFPEPFWGFSDILFSFLSLWVQVMSEWVRFLWTFLSRLISVLKCLLQIAPVSCKFWLDSLSKKKLSGFFFFSKSTCLELKPNGLAWVMSSSFGPVCTCVLIKTNYSRLACLTCHWLSCREFGRWKVNNLAVERRDFLDSPLPLMPEFIRNIRLLGRRPSAKLITENLIKKYGTHFLLSATLGGRDFLHSALCQKIHISTHEE